MERYGNGWCKVYLAEFVNKRSKNKFYKIGYTTFKDAMDRFRYEPDGYKSFEIRILSTIMCDSINAAKLVEKTFLVNYPKNLWVEEKIKGVTEIFKLPHEEYLDLLGKFRKMNTYSKKLLNLTQG